MKEVQNLLFALDQLGKSLGNNRDLYYTLGQYLGYRDGYLSSIESMQDPLSCILCSTCTQQIDNIAEFLSTLNATFMIMVILIDLHISLLSTDSPPY